MHIQNLLVHLQSLRQAEGSERCQVYNYYILLRKFLRKLPLAFNQRLTGAHSQDLWLSYLNYTLTRH